MITKHQLNVNNITKSVQTGDIIPDFSLPDQDGNILDIRNYRGIKNLVIFFYPRDDSFTCTKEACYFRDLSAGFEEADAAVIGISAQSTGSHKKFAVNNRLNYPILSDVRNVVRKLFGIPPVFFGLLPGRVTYVADKNGKVVLIIDSNLDAQHHVNEALKICMALKENENA